jgi:hypothetical protein
LHLASNWILTNAMTAFSRASIACLSVARRILTELTGILVFLLALPFFLFDGPATLEPSVMVVVRRETQNKRIDRCSGHLGVAAATTTAIKIRCFNLYSDLIPLLARRPPDVEQDSNARSLATISEYIEMPRRTTFAETAAERQLFINISEESPSEALFDRHDAPLTATGLMQGGIAILVLKAQTLIVSTSSSAGQAHVETWLLLLYIRSH